MRLGILRLLPVKLKRYHLDLIEIGYFRRYELNITMGKYTLFISEEGSRVYMKHIDNMWSESIDQEEFHQFLREKKFKEEITKLIDAEE